MSKEKTITFAVEGPDWEHEVPIDPTMFEDERSQLFEAATKGLEQQMKVGAHLNVGAIILVRKARTKKEAMVNAYICLSNIGQYELAESLRLNFKKKTGQDLAADTLGYSF